MKTVRTVVLSLVVAAVSTFGWAASSRAASNPASCVNDIDCVANPACGGDVCDYPALTCQPANAAAQGSDGWCTTDTDCKCHGQGAKCVGVYCTFTVPQSGAGGAAGSGAAGHGATGGNTGGGSGGTPGTGGTSASGGSAGPTSTSSGGGCSLGGAGAPRLAAVLLAALAGLIVARRRRR